MGTGIRCWKGRKGRSRGNLAAAAIALAAAMCCFWGCAGAREGASPVSEKGEPVPEGALVVYCPHPLDFINPIVAEFEERTGTAVYVQTGGTGELLNRAEEGQEPLCDIFWGGSLSTTMPRRALFEPYISENEDEMRDEFHNIEGNMTRFTDIPSVIMVNTNLIGDTRIEGYEDLLKPELKGKIAMCSPTTSSSAYEHLINMLYAMGNGEPEKGWDYVERFCENLDGVLLKSSSEVYRGVAEGRFAAGLTFEEGGARFLKEKGPVRLVYMKEGVISTPDVVCIVRGARHREEAKAFVDFVTGRDAQAVIAASLSRRSVRKDVKEPAGLPPKEELHLIRQDLELGIQKKAEWQSRFEALFEAAAAEGEGR